MRINNVEKERRSRYPAPDRLYLGRDLSTTWASPALVTAVLTERRGQTAILLLVKRGTVRSERWVQTVGDAHAPVLIGVGLDRMALVWVETGAGVWSVKALRLDADAHAEGSPETLHTSRQLIYQPAGICVDGALHVAWSGIAGRSIRVHWQHNTSGRWAPAVPVSDPGLNAFRPSLCAAESRLYMAWDQYRDRDYEVVLAAGAGERPVPIRTLGQTGEKWCFPSLAAAGTGPVWMSWYVETDVEDDLGIVDHSGCAMAARVVGDQVDLAEDCGHADDPRIIADMRDGMLPAKVYKGYLGHRRRPMMAVCADGTPWVLWEVRPEVEKTGVAGYLLGRRQMGDGRWTEALRLVGGKYAYACAASFHGNELPVAYLIYENEGAAILDVAPVNMGEGQRLPPNPWGWSRWHPVRIVPPARQRPRITCGDSPCNVYWVDTHVHSNFSADAEGEADELIHFSRDRAGLDVVAITDNDVYPHKPLFRAEWAIHQELCRFFTVPGRFVVLNGYEFTFHDPTLRPDFNHRIVLYPDADRPLLRRIDAEAGEMAELYRQLRGTGAMCYPHHCSYDLSDPDFEWNVEVCSSWRVCIEESNFSIRQLQQGRRFGFLGSSDTHRLVPGLGGALTGMYAEELTPASLFEAYRKRRLVASQGCRATIDFRVNDLFIGEEGTYSGALRIRGKVQAEAPIETLKVIRDGVAVHSMTGSGKWAECMFEDRDVPVGLHFYFLRVKLEGDPSYAFDPAANALAPIAHESRYPHNLARARGVLAWTSPIWVQVEGS